MLGKIASSSFITNWYTSPFTFQTFACQFHLNDKEHWTLNINYVTLVKSCYDIKVTSRRSTKSKIFSP